MFGYSQVGLEFWAYPFQIVSSFKVAFRFEGTTTEIDGQSILRRLVYRPDSVVRIYAGPAFIVTEKIFVPLDQAGAIIGYDVSSDRPVDIVVHFVPVLDLMWPGGMGGQEATWDPAASAYLLTEPRHRFSGSIGSPDIIAHDKTENLNRRLTPEPGLAFTMRAGGARRCARVIIAGGPGRSATPLAQQLLERENTLISSAVEHYSSFLDSALQIVTPDQEVNRALAWAEIALDQAWVCNPDLGCGLVAGYGPSRKARRPQYDWFFAGDGMVDLPALLAAGQFQRAREEIEFILKYQDQQNGMIWHELAQSAGWLDWKSYPYMFVHVELTFDFLSAVANYYSVTNDRSFVEAHWNPIHSAFEYCRSLIDPQQNVPRIPPEKEGSREQDPLNEELALSASWVSALQSYAELAQATGHDEAAREAAKMRHEAVSVISKRYWDPRQNFWITGYTRSGLPLSDDEIGPVGILGGGLFSEDQRDRILQRLATSDYRTDWGMRGRARSSSSYDPNSYANGSVWAISTSRAAVAFWAAHRPATAFSVWRSLVPWSALDALGHMHETLAGDSYHEELESVPEQTWSSATFFEAAFRGLLGVEVDSARNRLTLAPHVPPTWDLVKVRNLNVGASKLNLTLGTSADEVRLEIENGGPPVEVVFDPEIPLGARLRRALLENHSIAARFEPQAEDSHASVEFRLPHGDTTVVIEYSAGVAIQPPLPTPMLGNASQAVAITKVNLRGSVYTVDFDYLTSVPGSFDLRTPWPIKNVTGASFEAVSRGCYRLTPSVHSQPEDEHSYQHGQVQVTFRSP
jgi:hypothetical protein